MGGRSVQILNHARSAKDPKTRASRDVIKNQDNLSLVKHLNHNMLLFRFCTEQDVKTTVKSQRCLSSQGTWYVSYRPNWPQSFCNIAQKLAGFAAT